MIDPAETYTHAGLTERLRVAGLLTVNAAEGQGWRPSEMEAL